MNENILFRGSDSGKLLLACTNSNIHVRPLPYVCQPCGGCDLLCFEDIFSFWFVSLRHASLSICKDCCKLLKTTTRRGIRHCTPSGSQWAHLFPGTGTQEHASGYHQPLIQFFWLLPDQWGPFFTNVIARHTLRHATGILTFRLRLRDGTYFTFQLHARTVTDPSITPWSFFFHFQANGSRISPGSFATMSFSKPTTHPTMHSLFSVTSDTGLTLDASIYLGRFDIILCRRIKDEDGLFPFSL